MPGLIVAHIDWHCEDCSCCEHYERTQPWETEGGCPKLDPHFDDDPLMLSVVCWNYKAKEEDGS